MSYYRWKNLRRKEISYLPKVRQLIVAELGLEPRPSCFRAHILTPYGTGGKHKAQGPNPALYLVLSGLTPCIYMAAASGSHLTIKQ